MIQDMVPNVKRNVHQIREEMHYHSDVYHVSLNSPFKIQKMNINVFQNKKHQQ